MINKKGRTCIQCGKPLDNCLDEDIVIVGNLSRLAHKSCTDPFGEELYND